MSAPAQKKSRPWTAVLTARIVKARTPSTVPINRCVLLIPQQTSVSIVVCMSFIFFPKPSHRPDGYGAGFSNYEKAVALLATSRQEDNDSLYRAVRPEAT